MVNSLTLTIALPRHTLDRVENRPGASSNDDRQVQLNHLALYAADWYLQCLQFETQHQNQSDWWIQYLSKSAALEIAGIGKIECIPVIGDAATATISSDLQNDRVGYLFVKLNDSLTSAEIIGFMPKYSKTVTLDRLESTDKLIDYLCDLESQPQPPTVIEFAKWFAGIFDRVWQEIEVLPLTPAYRSCRYKQDALSVKSVERGQEIKLGDTPESPTAILAVRVEQVDAVNSDVHLQISPEYHTPTLPIGMKFSAIDDRGAKISSIETKAGDIYGEIILDNGKEGEKFSIEIELNGFKKIAEFKIGT
jgi:Protein of unknown function (DUF1822)